MDNMINIKINPDIVTKASPNFVQIENKATAGIPTQDIIERNVIAEYDEEREDDEEGKSQTIL